MISVVLSGDSGVGCGLTQLTKRTLLKWKGDLAFPSVLLICSKQNPVHRASSAVARPEFSRVISALLSAESLRHSTASR